MTVLPSATMLVGVRVMSGNASSIFRQCLIISFLPWYFNSIGKVSWLHRCSYVKSSASRSIVGPFVQSFHPLSNSRIISLFSAMPISASPGSDLSGDVAPLVGCSADVLEHVGGEVELQRSGGLDNLLRPTGAHDHAVDNWLGRDPGGCERGQLQ